MMLGIATGRGKSAIRELRDAINPIYHAQIVIGCYNGASIIRLCDDYDIVIDNPANELDLVTEILSRYNIGKIEQRSCQVTLTPYGGDLIKLTGSVKLLLNNIRNIKIYRSSHSIDIFATVIGKQLVCDKLESCGNILTIGDSGSPGGNDEELLSTPYSLSCYEPTVNPLTGWHLAPAGHHFSKAALKYLTALKIIRPGVATLQIKNLEG